MKHLLLFLLFFSKCLAQDNSLIRRDTLFYKSGVIREIYDFNEEKMARCGYFADFDTLGKKVSEGTFKVIDSTNCLNCYERQYDGNVVGIAYSYIRELPIGVWKYYYPSGQLKEIGKYSESVHEYKGITIPYIMEDTPYNGYSDVDYLKHDIWEYYDEKGKNYKSVDYYQGQVLYITERY